MSHIKFLPALYSIRNLLISEITEHRTAHYHIEQYLSQKYHGLFKEWSDGQPGEVRGLAGQVGQEEDGLRDGDQ